MIVKEIVPDVFHLDFPTQFDLSSTFLRFQEHYESPEFKGKIFTVEAYRQWYTANSPRGRKTGKFTYYEDWSGFNVPSHAFEPFYTGLFDPLTNREQIVLGLFRDRRGGKFYAIGTFQRRMDVLRHEVAHGLFYTNQDYRTDVLAVLSDIPNEDKKDIENWFSEIAGYHPDVWTDELHAHLVSNPARLARHGIDHTKFSGAIKKLRGIFNRHCPPIPVISAEDSLM